jgi:hypothetical protein
MGKINYKSAGVDIDAGNEAVDRIKDEVKSTFTSNVLTGLGSFGSLYDLKPVFENYDNPVMVQSIDGVGTKTIIARKLGKFDTIGIDLLSAAANDILVMGARPLTFLDYIANDKLNPETIQEIVSGMVKACKSTGVSLVGGETAEMPDTYLPGEHDLVGIITGLVEKEKIITGENIKNPLFDGSDTSFTGMLTQDSIVNPPQSLEHTLKQFKDLDINALKTKLEELKEEQKDDSGYLKALAGNTSLLPVMIPALMTLLAIPGGDKCF